MSTSEYQLIQIVARIRRAGTRAPVTSEVAREIARDECPRDSEEAFALYLEASMDLATMLTSARVPGARDLAREVVDELDEISERARAERAP